MTRLKRDMEAVLNGDERRVLAERKEEIRKLVQAARSCKNNFKLGCIAQEVARLRKEYEELEWQI